MKKSLSAGLQNKMYQNAEKFILNYVSSLERLLNSNMTDALLKKEREKKKRALLASMAGRIDITRDQKQTFKSEILKITKEQRKEINKLFNDKKINEIQKIRSELLERKEVLGQKAIEMSKKEHYGLFVSVFDGIDVDKFNSILDNKEKENVKMGFIKSLGGRGAYKERLEQQPEDYRKNVLGE